MASTDDLKLLEQMFARSPEMLEQMKVLAQIKQADNARALKRKAEIMEMTRPLTCEEEYSLMQRAAYGKKTLELRSAFRKRRRLELASKD